MVPWPTSTVSLLPDGLIHIADGFAYYIETKVTTTTTYKDGTSSTDVDETAAMSPVYRDLPAGAQWQA